LAARIVGVGDTKVTLYSYVTGLGSQRQDRAIAAARAMVGSVNLISDLRLLGSKATVYTRIFIGPTRTHIVAS
jgi:hypothetical protein